MHCTTKKLAEVRIHSVEILLLDDLAVPKFCSKPKVAMFHLRNRLVCCLGMNYEKS